MLVSTGVMSNISPQKNARTPEQNISLRNLCKNFWLEETAILDMQMSKLPMISGYVLYSFLLLFSLDAPSPYACTQSLDFLIQK